MGALKPQKPHPILILNAEQGSAKSTTAKFLRDLIDPSASPLRSLSRSERDLMILAENNWVVAFDNLSGINHDLSDALCRLSTGGGFSTRALYKDAEEEIFKAARPIVLNGIDELTSRPDLADRAMIVSLPRIPDNERKYEADLWDDFIVSKPKILGALLDAVSCALRNHDKVELKVKPRMADFARWIVGAEEKLPWKPNQFIEIYNSNRDEAALDVFDSDIVAVALRDFIERKREWSGTTTDLKKELETNLDDEYLKRDKAWPKTPSYLSNKINRLAPALRSIGI